jgi:hypothetical protein
MRSLRFFLLSVVMLMAIAACAAARQNRSTNACLATGVWGGDHVILQVNSGGAELEFECATGRITESIHPDSHGDFDVPGEFHPQSHGPTRDDAPAAQNIHYKGRVEGNTMTFTIVKQGETLGTYTVTRGEHPALKKCG